MTFYVNKNNLEQFTKIATQHLDIIRENNDWRINQAISKCFGNLHHCVDYNITLQTKIYN